MSLSRQQGLGSIARFDLATGYPSAPLASPLEAGRDVPPARAFCDDTSLSDHDCASTLERAARRVLSIANELSVVATLTGTIALERCLRVGELLAQEAHKSSLLLLTHENSIDLARELVTSRPGWSMRVVGYGPDGPSVGEFVKAIAELRQSKPGVYVVVVVTSPNNPDGGSLSSQEWRNLSEECATGGAFLVVDHCFLLADPFRPRRVPAVWDEALVGCHWAGVWDTGKTINLNGPKFGFVITASADVTRNVVRAVEEIHVVLPRDHSQLMSAALSETEFFDSIQSRLMASCTANLNTLKTVLRGWPGLWVRAGATFACVHMPEGPRGVAVELQEALLRRGVAVAASESFWPTGGAEYIRVSLARDSEYFSFAVAEFVAGGLDLLPTSYRRGVGQRSL